jgi:NAD(P)-dependent dehydrogenase (short-subunit alcohol dehydrogenase family)
MIRFDTKYWALIVGGSSGFGLATARKLAAHGMNLCIVHRDRRGAMKRIQPAFDRLRESGVSVLTFNLDGLSAEGRGTVLAELAREMGDRGGVRLLLHSVAFGNLKLLTPWKPPPGSQAPRRRLAAALQVSDEAMERSVAGLFAEGLDALAPLAPPPDYSDDQLLEEEDFARTLHAMGSNIVEWVQALHTGGLFTVDARVVSLTSEGNQVAWRSYAAISAAKAVLESVSRAMAVEFAPYGIRTNVVQAGVTDTAALQAIPGNRHIKAGARLRNPFGRLTEPEDVADVIFLLCMDEAAWINGALICADGGERLG